jgi:hypothetical protein
VNKDNKEILLPPGFEMKIDELYKISSGSIWGVKKRCWIVVEDKGDFWKIGMFLQGFKSSSFLEGGKMSSVVLSKQNPNQVEDIRVTSFKKSCKKEDVCPSNYEKARVFRNMVSVFDLAYSMYCKT